MFFVASFTSLVFSSGHFPMLLMSSNFYLYVTYFGYCVVENLAFLILLENIDFYSCMPLICLTFLKLAIYFCSDRSRVESSLGLE